MVEWTLKSLPKVTKKTRQEITLPIVDNGSGDCYFALVQLMKLWPKDYTFKDYAKGNEDGMYNNDDTYNDQYFPVNREKRR